MKKRKYIGISFYILFFCMFFTGCAEVPDDAIEGETGILLEGEQEKGSTVSGVIDENLNINAKITNLPEKESYPVVEAKIFEDFDIGPYLEVFFSGEEEKKNDNDEDGFTLEVNEINTYEIYDRKDNRLTLECNSGFCEYMTDIYRIDQYTLELGEKNAYKPALFWEGDEDTQTAFLNDYTLEEAIEDIRGAINKLGLSAEETPYCAYCVTGDKLNELSELMWADEVEGMDSFVEHIEYEEKDGIYCMVWRVMLDDVPVLNGNYRDGGMVHNYRMGQESGSSIFVVLNKENGILYFYMNHQYEVLGEREPEDIIGLKEALTHIKDYFEGQVLDAEYTVSKIDFCYVPVITRYENYNKAGDIIRPWYDMTPCYVFDVQHEFMELDGEILYIVDLIVVNAITGEIVPTALESEY